MEAKNQLAQYERIARFLDTVTPEKLNVTIEKMVDNGFPVPVSLSPNEQEEALQKLNDLGAFAQNSIG